MGPAQLMAEYQFFNTQVKENIGYIWFENPPLNELSIPVMEELIAIHREMEHDGEVWGVILTTDNRKFFCNGLSPDFLLGLDHAGRLRVFEVLMDLMRGMYGFSKPEVACIPGHAMAGGAVLGILCDYRFMAEEKSRYSFSEVAVGLTLPRSLLAIIERVTGPAPLRNIAQLATAYKAAEAREIGLVDRVFPVEDLLAETEAFLKNLFQNYPLASVRSVKSQLRRPILESMDDLFRQDREMLESFVSGNFLEGLRAVKERRRPKFENP